MPIVVRLLFSYFSKVKQADAHRGSPHVVSVIGQVAAAVAKPGNDTEAPVEPTADGPLPALSASDPGAGEDETGLGFWQRFADETVRRSIHLFVQPELDAELLEMLKSCPCAKLKATPAVSTIMVYYDEKYASEAASSPWARKCPSRKIHMETCLAQKVAADGGVVPPGTIYVLPDHGKQGNKAAIKKAFELIVKGIETCERSPTTNLVNHAVYELFFDETSLRNRNRTSRHRLMDQTEQLIIFTDTMASIPDRSRAFYPGTNRGKVWGFINMEPVEQLWHMSWADKKYAWGRPCGKWAEGQKTGQTLWRMWTPRQRRSL